MKLILTLLLAVSTTSIVGCYYHPHHDRDSGRYERRTSGHEHGDRDRRDDGHQKDRSH